jgi:protein TonB
MIPLKETLEAPQAAAEDATTQTGSQTSDRAKGDSGHLRSDAVSLNVEVKIHGSRITDVVRGVTPHTEPFEEQTSTMIVFPQGGVVKMSTVVTAGQMLVLANLKSGHDAICRVVKVRACGLSQSYVEIEFTHPQPGYWGVRFPSDVFERMPQPAAPAAIRPPQTSPLSPVPVAAKQEREEIKPIPDIPRSPVAMMPTISVQPASENVVADTAVKEPPVLTIVPPASSRAAQLSTPESSFVSIGSQEKVEPAASVPTLKFSASHRIPAISMADLRGDEQLGAISASFPAEVTTTEPEKAVTILPVVTEPTPLPVNAAPTFGRFAAAASSSGRAVASLAAFGSSSLGGVLETGDAEPKDGQKKTQPWIFIAAGAAAAVLLIAAVFYFHGSGSSASTQPTPQSSSVAPAPVNNPSYDANQSPASSPTAQGSIAKPMVASRAPAAAVRAADPAPVRENKAPAETQEPQPAPTEAASQKAQGPAPDMFGALNAHPVNAQRGSSSAASSAAPSLDSGSAPSDIGDLAGIPSSSAGPAPPKFVSSGMVRVGGSVRPPALVTSVMPVFPAVAKTARVQGDVVLDTSIDKLGNVIDAKVNSGPQLLRQAAVDAVRRWKYAPTLVDGVPTAVEMTVTIKFNR